MDPVYNQRFDSSYYISTLHEKLQTVKTSVSQIVDNVEFTELVNPYNCLMTEIFRSKKWQKILANKSLAQMFLDKTEKMVGKWNPINEHLSQYGFNSSTFASMEMMRHLENILDSEELDDKSRNLIQQWIKAECEYLPLPIFIDGIRSKIPHTLDFIAHPSDRLKQRCLQSLTQQNSIINEDDATTFATTIVVHLKQLKPKEEFKLLGGHFIHETRIRIQKNVDGTYNLIHFNTGDGRLGRTSGIIIKNIKPEDLESINFWKQFVYLKITKVDMHEMNNLLMSLDVDYIKEPEATRASVFAFLQRNPDRSIPSELCKQSQQTDSCPSQSIEADFKHWFISNFEDMNKGIEMYKIITALISKDAINEITSEIDPQLTLLFQQKSSIKHRYLDWLQVSNDEEKYALVKAKYIETLLKLDPKLTEENLLQLIAGHSKIMSLSILDKQLSLVTKSLPIEKYLTALESAEEICQINGHSFIDLKRKAFEKKLKEFLKKTVDFHESRFGKLTYFMEWISHSLFPDYMHEYIQTYLFKATIVPAAIRDMNSPDKIRQSFVPMLQAAVKIENPETIFSFIQDLYQSKVLNFEGLMDILTEVETLTLAENIARLSESDLQTYHEDERFLLHSILEPEKLVQKERQYVGMRSFKSTSLISIALADRNDPTLTEAYYKKYPALRRQ